MDTVTLLILVIVALILSICCMAGMIGFGFITVGKHALNTFKGLVAQAAVQARETEPLITIQIQEDFRDRIIDPNEELTCTRNRAFQKTLLCAAHFAEHIYDGDKRAGTKLVDYFGSQWKTFETSHSATEDKTHFLCAYQTSEPGIISRLIVVIRGTNSTEDIVTDIEAFFVDINGDRQSTYFATRSLWGNKCIPLEDAKGLLLHRGFHSRACDMLQEFDKFISGLKFNSQSRVAIIGHSLGGAIATLFGMSFAWRKHSELQTGKTTEKPVTVFAIAAPRCFAYSMIKPTRMFLNDDDAEKKDHAENVEVFEKQMDKLLKKTEFASNLKVVRLKNHADPVTDVPFSTMGENLCRHVTPYVLVLERDSEMRDAHAGSSKIAKIVLRTSTVDDEAHAARYAQSYDPRWHPSQADAVLTIIQRVVSLPNHKMDSYRTRLLEVVGNDRQDKNGDWIDGVACEPDIWAAGIVENESWWTATETEDATVQPQPNIGSRLLNWSMYNLNKLTRMTVESALDVAPASLNAEKVHFRKSLHKIHKLVF